MLTIFLALLDRWDRRSSRNDIYDDMGTNATASFMLNDHHHVRDTEDPSGFIDYCELCLFAAGWVQPTVVGPDERGHATAATSSEVRAWIARHDRTVFRRHPRVRPLIANKETD